jgi:ParB/Sulfiredoxin domain
MATITAQVGRQVALDQIRVPENVRTLDEAHVQALAGSIKLQGILVPLVVRDDGDVFELVAGFHRVAAAKSVGLAEVPVVVREAQTEDADRAVENITSCRRRHDVIYADRVVIPMSELTCATVRREPAGEVGIRTRTDPGSRLRHTIWLKWRLPLDSESEHAIRTRRHARDSSVAGVWEAIPDTLARLGMRARDESNPS